MGVSPWNGECSSSVSPNVATRVEQCGFSVAPFNALVGGTGVLETVIRIVVIAQSRHVCRCPATQANAPNDYLGLASESGAWHCFVIQSQRNERVVVLQRDVRVVESQCDVM